MKNAQFWLGLLLGTTISLVLSLGIFYYYVVNEIESAKKETRKEYEGLKEYWNKYMKEEVSILKETAIDVAKQKLKDLQELTKEKKEEKTEQ